MRKVASPIAGAKLGFLMVLGQLSKHLKKDEMRSGPPTINKTEVQTDQRSKENEKLYMHSQE